MPEAAAEIYEKIIEAQPNQTYNYRYLASAYAAAGEREKAIQLLRKRLEVGEIQSEVDTILLLADFYKTSGELEDFIVEYEAKLAEKPTEKILLYLVASMKIMANDLEGADTLVYQLFDDTDAPVNTRWLNSLAVAYRRADDRARELRLLETAVKAPEQLHLWSISETYQKLGAAYAGKGEKEKAQNAFRKMGTIRIMLTGNNTWERRRIAQTYMQHEMWDDAEAFFTEIINDLTVQAYDREQAQDQLMTIQQRRLGLETTTQLTQKIQKMDIGTQRALAKEYMRRGETKRAMEIYEYIAKAIPEDLESRAQLATLYSRQNDYDRATDTWKALLEADPENTKYQDGLVATYQSFGKIDKAFELAQQYVEANTGSGVHYTRLAKLYADEDRVDEAIAAYNKSVELAPGDGHIYHELAGLHFRKDDTDGAEKALQAAIQYTGQAWERRNIERELIEHYHRQGKLEEMLAQAETDGTLTFEMQRERAQRYRNAGKLEKSVNAYKKALDMTSDSYDRRRINQDLLDIYVKLDKTDAAIEAYEAIASVSSDSWARQTLIDAYKNEGKLAQLRTFFESRREKAADDPAVIEMVAEIYWKANDYEKAAEAYKALSKVQPSNVNSFYYAAAALNKNEQPELAKETLNQGEAALSVSNQKTSMYFLRTLGNICLDGDMYAPST